MINLFLDLRNSNFDDNKKLNFKEFNINVIEDIIIYDFFFQNASQKFMNASQ